MRDRFSEKAAVPGGFFVCGTIVGIARRRRCAQTAFRATLCSFVEFRFGTARDW